MEFFDPKTITGADWPNISILVTFLWLVVIFNVGFAFAMLIGHAVIPSLIATGHIPSRFRNFSPLLTVAGFIALVVALLVVANWLFGLQAVYGVYPKQLI